MRVFTNFEYQPLYFEHPTAIVRCYDPLDLPKVFEDLEGYLSQGYYLAGFLSYEAGMAFETGLFPQKKATFPLLCLGVYKSPHRMIPKDFRKVNARSAKPAFSLVQRGTNIDRESYGQDIDAIRSYIAQGEVYQITYCLKLKFDVTGKMSDLFQVLHNQQSMPYSAFVQSEDMDILSMSPERFIKKIGHKILTEPMKGTWPRGSGWLDDVLARGIFSKDRKNRAENVMIADLLRNDLGRVGRRIRAPQLFTITPYRTLFQMTSTVTAEVDRDLPLWDLFKALFPSGSVTGAPRLRAMQVIRELEREERKIYTGAIGWVSPKRDMYFNIPIRTLLVQDGKGEMGIGGGIVWDSTADGEWAEGLLKARFITEMSNMVASQ